MSSCVLLGIGGCGDDGAAASRGASDAGGTAGASGSGGSASGGLGGAGGTLPEPECSGENSQLFHEGPVPVEVAGYEGDVVAPFVTRDGEFLLFHDRPAGGAPALHLAKHVGFDRFEYAGEVPGAASSAFDGTPSVGPDGRVYFVSFRELDTKLPTVFSGVFDGAEVKAPARLTGLAAPSGDAVIFDAEIGPSGTALFLAEGRRGPSEGTWLTADLVLAEQVPGDAARWTRADKAVLEAVNTDALEYGAASANWGAGDPGLSERIYFTRRLGEAPPELWFSERAGRRYCPAWSVKVIGKAVLGENPAVSMTDAREDYSVYFNRLQDGRERLFRLDAARVVVGP